MAHRKMNLFPSALFGLFLLAGSVVPAFAQYCPSSQLIYIVRDENGKIINPAKLDAPDFIEENVMAIDYAEAEKDGQSYWGVGEVVKKARAQKSNNRDKETGTLFTLHQFSGGACNFTEPVIYKLTLGDKTMNLVFRFAAPKNDYGENYLVDSLPFAQGTYEIDLPEKSDYYSPANWRKTSDKAEKPAPIAAHHIRGRVINAVTKQPIENAVVLFDTIPIYYGKHDKQNKSKVKTNADGRFALENLRGDYFEQITQAAVFAEHPDFAVGTFAYLFQKDENYRIGEAKALVPGKNARLESRDDLTIELVPLVTVTGRIVDATTGDSPPETANLPEKFYITAKYGKGGYLGGNLNIPQGETTIRPQPDGSFTFKTAPGKVEFYGSGKIGEKGYRLIESQTKMEIGANGLTNLILKFKRDPWEVKKETEALLVKGNEHHAAARHEDALKAFEEAAQLSPENPLPHIGIVRALAALKRTDEAVTRYQKAVAANSSDAAAHYGLGMSLGNAEKRDEAARSFREAIRLKPDFIEAHYALAGVYRKLKQTESERAHLLEVVRLRPDFAKAYENVAYTYIDEKKYLDGLIWLKEAVRINPKVSALAYLHIGYQSRELGLWKESLAAYRQAVALAPTDARAHHGVGWALFKLNGRDESAVAALREAARLKPDDAAIQRDLGAVLFALYNYKEALAAYAQAARLDPKDAETQLGLGLTYYRLNNLEAMQAQHKILLALDAEKAKKLQAVLDQ